MLEKLEQALVEAINDEYKARATYRLVIKKFGEIRPFVHIIESEERHIQALIPLFNKYRIAIPVDDWENNAEAPDSVTEACQIGVQSEIDNGSMYERLLDLTKEYPDVQRVFLNLQRASQENHLLAFQRCAERGRNPNCGRGKGRQHRSAHGHKRDAHGGCR